MTLNQIKKFILIIDVYCINEKHIKKESFYRSVLKNCDQKMDLWNRQYEYLKEFVNVNHKPPNSRDKIHDHVISQWYLKQKNLMETGKLVLELCDKI